MILSFFFETPFLFYHGTGSPSIVFPILCKTPIFLKGSSGLCGFLMLLVLRRVHMFNMKDQRKMGMFAFYTPILLFLRVRAHLRPYFFWGQFLQKNMSLALMLRT